MNSYVGNPKEHIKNILELMSEFSNLTGYKVNIQ